MPSSKFIHGMLHDNSCLQNTAAEQRANKYIGRIFFPISAFASQKILVRRIASSISNAIYWMAETVRCLILSLSNFANRMAITTDKQAHQQKNTILFIFNRHRQGQCEWLWFHEKCMLGSNTDSFRLFARFHWNLFCSTFRLWQSKLSKENKIELRFLTAQRFSSNSLFVLQIFGFMKCSISTQIKPFDFRKLHVNYTQHWFQISPIWYAKMYLTWFSIIFMQKSKFDSIQIPFW